MPLIYIQHNLETKAKELFPHLFNKQYGNRLNWYNLYRIYTVEECISEEDQIALKLTFTNREFEIKIPKT